MAVIKMLFLFVFSGLRVSEPSKKGGIPPLPKTRRFIGFRTSQQILKNPTTISVFGRFERLRGRFRVSRVDLRHIPVVKCRIGAFWARFRPPKLWIILAEFEDFFRST